MISRAFRTPSAYRKLPIAAALWFVAALAFAYSAAAQKAGSSEQLTVLPAAHAQDAPPANARADVAQFVVRVQAALAEAHAARGYWGILVADRDTGEVLYELNADHFFMPASNAKIFTTALALATLGRDYRFRTTLESQAPLGNDGRLAGDLRLMGRGDPDLSNRVFPYAGRFERDGPVEKILAEMADAAVAKGLREVDGDIVADDSYFPYDPYPAGWTTGDLFFTFGAPVSAIAFNENSFSIDVQPGTRIASPAVITTEPNAASDTFRAEITTSSAGAEPDFAVVREPGMNFILVRGSIPLGHAPIQLDFAMTQPAETAALALKQLLEARGVRVTGGALAQHAPPPETTAAGEPVFPPASPPPAPAAVVLAEHLSPPLIECIRVTNKVSQNLHAELLLRTVGREKTGLGSTAAGLKVERDFLAAAGIADGDVVLSDGSGLSRDDLVTPRAVVALLRYAARQPWGADFLSTLPVAGVDGTLQDRMKDTPAAGRIEAKTGSHEDAHALSGYATSESGESLVFAIFGNNNRQHGADATTALDAIASAMVETLGAQPRATKEK
ncbi:MAG: D-alanyl-D-alanine carboxypeptidase/D-alanyl-D-alanine-endopeptidase [Candidatus Acidiferrales bacterium]